MAHTATVTAKTGPDRVNTALAHPNVRSVHFDLKDARLQLTFDPPPVTDPATSVHTSDLVREFDLVGVTAVAVTITAGQYAFVVS